MTAADTETEAQAVLHQALECLIKGSANPIVGPHTATWSERCVEVPWVAGHLTDAQRLLDVGYAMAPPEWMGVLLATQDRGTALTGIDIVDPQRVRSRYPAELVDQVLTTPVRVESILDAQPIEGTYDTITCVSTLEHIGFDIATPPETTDTAYVRAERAEDAQATRDPQTDRNFLDAVARLLEPGGSLLLSVPAGRGGAILHQDSLGLFTYQFEYGPADWNAVTSDSRFDLVQEAFFRHDEAAGWQEVGSFDQMTGQSSAMRPFATACAMARMTLR
ncbi:MAG: methyltransferase domain-containing protein [Actinomycetota bacterium]|nr:methyltransferase domain-containing protein [Actinomycetota bacterium]MDP2287446.1 methyltransferase domain-containing protein [Actinomycetota bacterium]